MLAFAVVVFGGIYLFTQNVLYGSIGGGLILLLAIFSLLSETKFKVIVDQGKVTFIDGKKNTKTFVIDEAAFQSLKKTGTSTIGTECKSTVKTVDSEETFDCTPLGKKRYSQLLAAIGMDEDAPTELLTTKKSNK